MKDDTTRWRKLGEAEVQRQKQKSIAELHEEGYRLYRQCQYRQASVLFAQAAALAKQRGNLSKQCENLHWEGHCYSQDNCLKKALACFLKAEQLGGLDAINQFLNLINLFNLSMELHLPQAEIQSILGKLIPYKSTQQIGGSKSMVLEAEYQFLSACNKDVEALSKAQEAFASQVNKMPFYNDIVYFDNLIVAYRLNDQISEAWAILRRWQKEGSTSFADTKRDQLMAEFGLYYYENKLDDAWDVLQRVKAEEQYLRRAGMYVDTLSWEILIGTKTGHLEQIKPTLNLIFKKYRHSEDFADRYMCYKAFAHYCCASYRLAPPENRGRMERHAKFWIAKAEQMAQSLDDLLQVTWRTKEIQKIRKDFEKI